jgi:hypothetical protein
MKVYLFIRVDYRCRERGVADVLQHIAMHGHIPGATIRDERCGAIEALQKVLHGARRGAFVF